MDVVAFQQRILTAFADVARPEAPAIAPHDCEECEELRQALAPFTSNSVPVGLLRKYVWDLPLLSAEAKQYFLPAWLCASLSEDTWDFADALMQNIDSNIKFDPVGGYSDEQWAVLFEWLEIQAACDEPITQERAIEVNAKARKRSAS
jgi:hypothetical protein